MNPVAASETDICQSNCCVVFIPGTTGKRGEMLDTAALQQINLLLIKLPHKNATWIKVLV